MIPNWPVEYAQRATLLALQQKPTLYHGTALPKDPKRLARRLKVMRRDQERGFVRG